jgi:hypothetical protein
MPFKSGMVNFCFLSGKYILLCIASQNNTWMFGQQTGCFIGIIVCIIYQTFILYINYCFCLCNYNYILCLFNDIFDVIHTSQTNLFCTNVHLHSFTSVFAIHLHFIEWLNYYVVIKVFLCHNTWFWQTKFC